MKRRRSQPRSCTLATIAVAAAVVAVGAISAEADPLIPGGGSKRTDCIAEFSTIQIHSSAVDSDSARLRLRCTDGDQCDADGQINDRCAFPIVVCLNNTDPDLPLCTPSEVDGFEVKQRRSATDPELAALQASVIGLGLPTAANVCSGAVDLTVPVRVKRTTKRRGKKRVATLARTRARSKDRDWIVMVCDPAAPAPVNKRPQVSTSATPMSGKLPLAVSFTSTATDPDGSVVSIAWAFGDGATATGTAVSHTYQTKGAYTATATATDDEGASGMSELTIQVDDYLGVQHGNHYPTRIAEGPGGKLYVSDAKRGAVFIYNANLTVIGELKNLDRPLGVAVDTQGRMYVGSDGKDSVEVYSADGVPLFAIDEGSIAMPNDLAIDRQGRLYVADSLSDTVMVYDSSGTWLRDIGGPGDGDEQLRFPAAVAVAYRRDAGGQEVGELYVADQGHSRFKVFNLTDGTFRRARGGPVPAFSSEWHGLFVKLQSVALDANGFLHAVDSYTNRIQILDRDSGAYQDSYGSFGTGAGELNLPLDIAVTSSGRVVVANAENHRVELIYTMPAP